MPAYSPSVSVSVISGRGVQDALTSRLALLEAYHASVFRAVPQDRLIAMDVKEGWAPLAKFLDKPIPDEPFPRVNESQALDEQAKSLLTMLLGTWVGIISVVAGSAYAGWRLLHRR